MPGHRRNGRRPAASSPHRPRRTTADEILRNGLSVSSRRKLTSRPQRVESGGRPDLILGRQLSAVVSPEGLVGLVASVDEHTSVVLSWAHPEFRASAVASDGKVVGIAAPHGAEGPNVWLLELQGVLYRHQVPTGTVIVTSGLGGVFPRGIPIGVVIGPAREEKGWGRTYLVRPVIHPAELSHVMILTSSRPAGSDLRNAFTVPQDSALPNEVPPQ